MPRLCMRKKTRTKCLEGPHARKVFTEKYEPDGWNEFEMPEPYDAAAAQRAEAKETRKKAQEEQTAKT